MQTIKLTENTKCKKYLKQQNRTEIIKDLITSKLNYKKKTRRDIQVTEKKKIKKIQASDLIFFFYKERKLKIYEGN